MTSTLPAWMDPDFMLQGAPKETYFSFQNQFGGDASRKRYFQGQFQNIFNEFLGRLGEQVKTPLTDPNTGQSLTQNPTLTFEDFLQEPETFNQIRGVAPSIRGATAARFAPPARFLNF